MISASEIFKKKASALVCAVKFGNSFARHQHLFDIAATLTEVESNNLSYSAPL